MKNNPELSAESLQMKLSDLAAQYRASIEDSEEQGALKEYYTTFQQLLEHCGKIIALDPDAELPDCLMPKEYVDFWLKDDKDLI